MFFLVNYNLLQFLLTSEFLQFQSSPKFEQKMDVSVKSQLACVMPPFCSPSTSKQSCPQKNDQAFHCNAPTFPQSALASWPYPWALSTFRSTLPDAPFPLMGPQCYKKPDDNEQFWLLFNRRNKNSCQKTLSRISNCSCCTIQANNLINFTKTNYCNPHSFNFSQNSSTLFPSYHPFYSSVAPNILEGNLQKSKYLNQLLSRWRDTASKFPCPTSLAPPCFNCTNYPTPNCHLSPWTNSISHFPFKKWEHFFPESTSSSGAIKPPVTAQMRSPFAGESHSVRSPNSCSIESRSGSLASSSGDASDTTSPFEATASLNETQKKAKSVLFLKQTTFHSEKKQNAHRCNVSNFSIHNRYWLCDDESLFNSWKIDRIFRILKRDEETKSEFINFLRRKPLDNASKTRAPLNR